MLDPVAAEATAVLPNAGAQGAAGVAGTAAMPAVSAQQVYTAPQPEAVGAAASSGGGKNKVIIIVAVVVIVVALAAIGGFAAWKAGLLDGILGSQQTASEQADTEDSAAAEQQEAEGEEETGQVEIPDVAGMTEEDATSALTAAGFLTPTIITQPSSEVAKGAVISQSPSAGDVADAVNTSITLTVSSGPQTVVKKEFTVVTEFMTWDEAKAYCEQQGGQACHHR